MGKPCIVLFCDDRPTGNIWEICLRENNCSVSVYPTVVNFRSVLNLITPNLVVIDITYRESNGIQICASLRKLVDAPIILLTPINNESYQLEAYNAGAGECVIKPISPALFLCKVNAWLRSMVDLKDSGPDEKQLQSGQLKLAHRLVTLPTGEKIRLSDLESKVMMLLMSRPGEYFSSDEIVEKIWGMYGEIKLVKTIMFRLRRKIEKDPLTPPVSTIHPWPWLQDCAEL